MRRLFNVKCVMFNVAVCILTLHITYYTLHSAFAESVSSSELINNTQQYNGKMVAYTGEVIGDIMKRGNYVWININDGKNAIGVWAQASLVKDITYTGSYKYIGDTVEVSGVFNRACPEHGGDLDIHAREIHKITPGRHIPEAIDDIGKRNAVIVLLGILCLIWILTQFKNK